MTSKRAFILMIAKQTLNNHRKNHLFENKDNTISISINFRIQISHAVDLM